MKGSLIQWTDNTYNPWLGCRKVAPECEKCYIVRQTPLRVRGIKHGSERHRCAESTLNQPLAWNRDAAFPNFQEVRTRDGRIFRGTVKDAVDWNLTNEEIEWAGPARPRVFCLSLGDWLDNEVPIEWLAELLMMINRCRNLDWQLLTKRPQNFGSRIVQVMEWIAINHGDIGKWAGLSVFLDRWHRTGDFWPHVWIGVSAGANQSAALNIPAKIHFLSCEPMLHALDEANSMLFDWIIFGGESEPGGDPRPFDVIHLDRALKLCRENKVPAFVKQMGGAPTYHHDLFDDNGVVTVGWREDVTFPGGCTIKLSDGHGGDMEQWPERFRVREFPKV